MTTTIKGRSVIGGVASGKALCCPNSIQGWAGMNGEKGTILEKGHIHEGESIDGRVLILPCSKGSCGWSCQFQYCMDFGFKPAAWVISKVDSKVGVASVVLNIPTVGDFDLDPFEYISDGDWVEVNGDTGEVKITKQEK